MRSTTILLGALAGVLSAGCANHERRATVTAETRSTASCSAAEIADYRARARENPIRVDCNADNTQEVCVALQRECIVPLRQMPFPHGGYVVVHVRMNEVAHTPEACVL